MGNKKGIEVVTFEPTGYKPLIDYGEWRVAGLKFCDDLLLENIKTMTAKDFGHADILDYKWGEFMHNSFAKGLEDRDVSKIDTYHTWVASVIKHFIKSGEKLDLKTVNWTHRER